MTQRTLPTAARRFGAALLFLAAGGLFMGGLGRSALAEGPEAAPEAPAAEMPEALGDLEKLENALKSKKSINDEIIQYVDLVGGHFRAIKGPEPAADDAPQEAKDEYAAAKKKFDKDFADYRKKAEKAIFKALGLVKLRGETNERNEVNMKAAQVIGSLAAAFPGGLIPIKDDEGAEKLRKANVGEREDLAKKLMKEIDSLHKAKYDLSSDVLQASFGALGQLNTLNSVEWMLADYSHAKNNEVMWLVAAHKALPSFGPVPGHLRYDLVEQFIRTYVGVESAANTSSTDPKDQAKKRFWDDIRTFTVPVVQYYAGNPVDAETNEALSTMGQFDEWFRDHKNKRKAPWTDE